MQTGMIIENCQAVFASDDGLTIFPDIIPVAHVLMYATGISLVIIIGVELVWFLSKRKTHRELLQIHSSFIHRSYVTMFEFVRPEGETKVDKLFNLLSLVFPEVEKFKKRLEEPPRYLFWLIKHRKFRRMCLKRCGDMTQYSTQIFHKIKAFHKKDTN